MIIPCRRSTAVRAWMATRWQQSIATHTVRVRHADRSYFTNLVVCKTAVSCSRDFCSHYPSYYSNLACFLYPAYASYKALSISPVNSQDATRQLERWLMYWAVVGSWVGMEAVAGWFLNLWVRSGPLPDHAADSAFSIPFYSLFKLAFFLWLSLPQTEGSTYLFNTLLAPTFHEHEHDIDAFLSSLKTRLSGAILELLTWAWGRARSALDVSLIECSRS